MLRRALGFKLASAARLLGQFVSYLEARGTSTVTTSDALAWAALPAGASPAWQAIRLTVVRGFAAYLHGIDPSVQVPPAGLIRRGSDRATPYLYSDAEIGALIAAAAGLQPRLRAATYQTPDRLAGSQRACRIGEAIKPDRGDLDWAQGVLVVRDAKFGKSRLVPLHPSTWRRSTVRAAARPSAAAARRTGVVRVPRRDAIALRGRATGVPAAHRAGRHRRRRALTATAPRPQTHLRGPHPARLVSGGRGRAVHDAVAVHLPGSP